MEVDVSNRLDNPEERLLLVATGSVHVALLPLYLQVFERHLRCAVRVVMTEAASQFLPVRTVQDFTGAETFTHLREMTGDGHSAHVGLPKWATRLLVLPCTANSLSKAAQGVADDLASLCVQGFEGPKHLAPAMSQSLWRSPAIMRNASVLRQDGWDVIEPRSCVALGTRDPGEGLSPTPRLVLTRLAEAMRTTDDTGSASVLPRDPAMKTPAAG
jgi:phosphopantothenoylcysteine synthetase/decarboxylase